MNADEYVTKRYFHEVTGAFAEQFSKQWREWFNSELARMESRYLSTLNVAQASNETVLDAVATLNATGGASDTTKQAATLESFERRLSRHSDHLAGLESRMKKVERKE